MEVDLEVSKSLVNVSTTSEKALLISKPSSPPFEVCTVEIAF